jgi:hypothetical protein
MIAFAILAAAVDLPVRTIPLSAAALARPIRIECPVDQTTRIVFPQPFVNVKTSAGAREALGLIPEASKPRGVIRVVPRSHPAKATIEARGPSVVLTLLLQAVPKGVGSEVRLTIEPLPPAQPVASPAPSVPASHSDPPAEGESAAPTAESLPDSWGSPAPAAVAAEPAGVEPTPVPVSQAHDLAPSPASAALIPPTVAPGASAQPPAMDLAGLLRAQPVAIGRREGLPGQRPFVLVDALRGDARVWFRFKLQGGAADRITTVALGTQQVGTFLQEADGKDLRVVVQVPRGQVIKKARLVFRTPNSGEYRFALDAPTLTNFLKSLF